MLIVPQIVAIFSTMVWTFIIYESLTKRNLANLATRQKKLYKTNSLLLTNYVATKIIYQFWCTLYSQLDEHRHSKLNDHDNIAIWEQAS